MIYPTVHLNGTSREELEYQFSGALAAIEVALDRIAAAAPNGRDYYSTGSQAIDRATEEHRAAMEQVQKVRDRYLALLERLSDVS